jgi:HAD superfamily hydrolase (TIGR01509 family)
MSTPPINAVLFDWDGTLLDSRAALLGAWHESTEDVIGRRFPATAAEEHEVFTLPGSQIWPRLVTGTADRDRLVARFQQAYERTGTLVRAIAGIPDALRQLRRAGVAIGVVTAKARRRFTADASRAGLADLIDVSVCVEDAPVPKPDPAPLRVVLEALGAPASEALMVGDTEVDVIAGRRAGTAAAGVTWGAGSQEELRRAGAEVVFEEPMELVQYVCDRHAETMRGPL